METKPMKAFVTTIGEKTTPICIAQLKKLGFDVVVLDKHESWYQKYKWFIQNVKEDCLRVDADIILSKSFLKEFEKVKDIDAMLVQFTLFDFYSYDLYVGGPVFYTKNALEIIREHWYKIGPKRPETDASRIPSINKKLISVEGVVGTHGFFQDKQTFNRALYNKTERKQLGRYNFDLAQQLLNL